MTRVGGTTLRNQYAKGGTDSSDFEFRQNSTLQKVAFLDFPSDRIKIPQLLIMEIQPNFNTQNFIWYWVKIYEKKK